MNRFLACFIVILVFTASGVSAGSGPDIRIIDDKVSIQAEGVPLSRLLRLLDQATGMASKVPPELANRNISVRFADLNFDEAIHKIFEGQPLDYVVVAGKSIIVTGTSQSLTARNTPGGPAGPPPQETFNDENPPFMQPMQNQPPQPPQPGMPTVVNGGQNQPAMIQTPFGAIPNPRANQPLQQQSVSPMVTPGQSANPFNNSLPGFNGSSQLPTLQSTPFGTQPQPANPLGYPSNAPGTPFPPLQPRPNP